MRIDFIVRRGEAPEHMLFLTGVVDATPITQFARSLVDGYNSVEQIRLSTSRRVPDRWNFACGGSSGPRLPGRQRWSTRCRSKMSSSLLQRRCSATKCMTVEEKVRGWMRASKKGHRHRIEYRLRRQSGCNPAILEYTQVSTNQTSDHRFPTTDTT